MKKSFLCVLLCILMILPHLVACGNGQDDVPDEPVAPVALIANGVSDYQIVYPAANELYHTAAEKLRDTIRTLTNVTLDVVSDTVPAIETEILVGPCNREAVTLATERVTEPAYTFAYIMVDKTLVLSLGLGSSGIDSATALLQSGVSATLGGTAGVGELTLPGDLAFVKASTDVSGPAALCFENAELYLSLDGSTTLTATGALTATCANGGTVYYALHDADGKMKICRKSGNAVSESAPLELGEAVSMCYNTLSNLIVVAHGDETLSMIDPETLTVVSTHTYVSKLAAIAYSESCNGYLVRTQNAYKLTVLDSTFRQQRLISMPSDVKDMAIGDVAADADYAYVLLKNQTGARNKKCVGVLICELETGRCLKNILDFDMSNRTPTSLAVNGSKLLFGASSFVFGDALFSASLVPTDEHSPYGILARSLNRDVDSEGLKITHLFDTYELTSLGANNVMQGGCTDGKYGYFCMEDQANNYAETSLHRTRIVKVDMATGELVDVSERLELDHSNDMCYNSKLGKLMVVHCGKGDAAREVSYVDPETLEITGNDMLPFGFYCMAYDEVNDRYMVGNNGRNFAILDSDFNVLVPRVNVGSASYCKEENLITQGSDCDSEYVYVVLGGHNGSAPWTNYLVVYDWNGNLIMAKIIPNMTAESENIFHIGNTIYVACNGENEPVYKIELMG